MDGTPPTTYPHWPTALSHFFTVNLFATMPIPFLIFFGLISVANAETAAPDTIKKQWNDGDKGLVCYVHEDRGVRSRCLKMAFIVKASSDSEQHAKRALGEERFMRGPALMPGCEKLDGLAARQCDIKKSLQEAQGAPATAKNATQLLAIIAGEER